MTASLPPPPPPPPSAPAAVVRSGRSTVWIGVSLAILGVVGAIVWAVAQFVLLSRDVGDLGRADTDAPYDFVVDDGGVSWTLFVEPQSASLGRVRFAIVDRDRGTEMALRGYGGSFTYDVPSHSGRAVATVQLPDGSYRLVVEGPVTIAVGPSPASRIGWMIGGGLLIAVPLVVGGGGLALVTAIRDTRRRTAAALPPAPSPWTAGEWPREPPG